MIIEFLSYLVHRRRPRDRTPALGSVSMSNIEGGCLGGASAQMMRVSQDNWVSVSKSALAVQPSCIYFEIMFTLRWPSLMHPQHPALQHCRSL